MEYTSEGIFVPLSLEEENFLIHQVASSLTIIKVFQLKLISEIRFSIGDLNTSHIPLGLKSILNKLLDACSHYAEKGGDDNHFLKLCDNVIEDCRKGWSHLSYWICSEQSYCYTLFWQLTTIIDKYQQLFAIIDKPINDQVTDKNNEKWTPLEINT